ncbi:hypothetical protein CDO24_14185 [Sinorhizobium meliloti]|nr:hypothetical protein CDO24_14185 [Sinorhizobium meliloti]
MPLLESDTETSNLSFKARDMANGTHRDAAEIVSATAGFDEFGSVTVGCTALLTLLGCLFACCVSCGHRGSEATQEKGQLACSAGGRVSACIDRHTHHSF